MKIERAIDQLAVRIDEQLCCGFASCAQICPELFALDPVSNRAKLLRPPQTGDAALLHRAETECPTRAIVITSARAGYK